MFLCARSSKGLVWIATDPSAAARNNEQNHAKKNDALVMRAVRPRTCLQRPSKPSPHARVAWGVRWDCARGHVMVQHAADAPNPSISTKKPKLVVLLSTRFFDPRWAK